MATKDSLSTKQSRSANAPTGEESQIPAQQPSGLGELATSMAAEAEKRLEAVQRTQISSWSGAEKMKEPLDQTPKRQSPSQLPGQEGMLWSCGWKLKSVQGCMPLLTRILTVSISRSTHSIELIQVALVCIWMRLANSKAGLIHDKAVVASKAILGIPTWMGHFARWRVKCMSISEASEIMAGCKRLEKENLRRARLELQRRISAMQVDSTLSASARPFQPRTAPHSLNEDEDQPVGPPRSGWSGNHPTLGLVSSSPMGRMPFHHTLSSEDEGASSDASRHDRPLRKRRGSRGSWKSRSESDSDDTHSSGRR